MNRYMNSTLPKKLIITLAIAIVSMTYANAQVENRWLSAGSLHNFYSSIGSEIEHAFVNQQQYGWQWPAIYRGQDAQATKAMWLGAKDVKDPSGAPNWPYRVVHVGPRVTGLESFTPIDM